MNEKDREYLRSHIAQLCLDMHLGDWSITLASYSCDEGSYAHINPTYGQRSAVLSVCDDFREVKEKRANSALVHELLHCHHAGVQHHVQDESFRGLIGEAAFNMWRLGFDQHHENAIDAVSRVIAPTVTPLEWPA